MKIQLNDNQIRLAKQWLPSGSHPYAHDNKMLWFWQPHYSGFVKNALKLSQDQIRQLNQLS